MKTKRRRSDGLPPSTRSRGRLSFSGSWEDRRDSRSPVAMPFTRGGYSNVYSSPSSVWVTAMRRGLRLSECARARALLLLGPRTRREFPVSLPVCSSRMEGCRNTNGKSMVVAAAAAAKTTSGGFKDSLVCVGTSTRSCVSCARDSSPDPSYRGSFIISCVCEYAELSLSLR